ncbi:MAG: hypothetical protein DHS20C17_29170 [Cyclobacteriaceae bacterium]|nr:MAG: hypothetical protein DHS20C17_29170 [Cyclobacteriaceae bacterium]
MESGLINIALMITYALIGIAVIAVIVLPLIKAIDDPKTLVGTAIGLGALVVLYGLSYAISGDEVLPRYVAQDVGPGISKVVGGLLTTMYLLFGAAILGIIFTEVSKAFK